MLQSETKNKIFPDDIMLETFGTTKPDTKIKHRYFFNQWMLWKDNRYLRLDNSRSLDPDTTRARLADLGLREFWDYQLRPNEIRFAEPEYLAMWKLSDDS
jgi:hypothetical protein